MHDIISPGWVVEFRGQDGHLYMMTDTLGCPMSFSSTEEARDHIHLVADCPIQVEHLHRFFERLRQMPAKGSRGSLFSFRLQLARRPCSPAA